MWESEVTMTSQQKAAMCSPGDMHVNATGSRIYGIPMTPSGNTTTIGNTTIGNTTTASPPFIP